VAVNAGRGGRAGFAPAGRATPAAPIICPPRPPWRPPAWAAGANPGGKRRLPWKASLPIPPWGIMLCIIALYVALGTFMEGFSMIITTVPVIFPVVVALGYDPIWFGMIVTMLVEIAQISPPDGTVMYVLRGMRRRPGPITDVFMGVYLLAVGILMVFPGLALWLPALMN
jgi:TRAP-type C4-dicarboxylate transport system permease large subunit